MTLIPQQVSKYDLLKKQPTNQLTNQTNNNTSCWTFHPFMLRTILGTRSHLLKNSHSITSPASLYFLSWSQSNKKHTKPPRHVPEKLQTSKLAFWTYQLQLHLENWRLLPKRLLMENFTASTILFICLHHTCAVTMEMITYYNAIWNESTPSDQSESKNTVM